MNISTTIKTGLLAGAMAVASPASAFVFFDSNGGDPGGVFAINAFDWSPDNALFEGIIPIPDIGDTPDLIDGTLRVQGRLTSAEASFIAAGTEITFQAVVPIRVTSETSTLGFLTAIDSILPGGTFDIFYDDFSVGIAGNDISGLGYGDGLNILSGSVLPASGVTDIGTITMTPTSDGLLDQFGADNQGGVTTLGISGNFPTMRIEVDAFDPLFFPADGAGNTIDIAGSHDLQLSGDNLAGFENVNPSDSVVGVAPDYGNAINDNLCGGGGGVCDLHAESDTRSPFLAQFVPEPGTTGLLGLSLLAIGAAARRKAKA